MSKRIAEALVECGYAYSWQSNRAALFVTIPVTSEIQKVDPFADTLEGRRQEDALEDWLVKGDHIIVIANNEVDAWEHSAYLTELDFDKPERLKRLDRIKWCFEQL